MRFPSAAAAIVLLRSVQCFAVRDPAATVRAARPPSAGAQLQLSRGRRLGESEIDGAYDCAAAPTAASCEAVGDYDLVPLGPDCKRYMMCNRGEIALMFRCGEGAAFDRVVRRCASEELVDCPCGADAGGGGAAPTAAGVPVRTRSFDFDADAAIQLARESWIHGGEGGRYDCAAAPRDDPCEDVPGYDLLPIPPDCRQYMLCEDRKVARMFSCAAGTAFHRGVKRCVAEELVDCPCSREYSTSDGVAKDVRGFAANRPHVYGGAGKGSTGVTDDGVAYTYVTAREYKKSWDPKTAKIVHLSPKSAKLSSLGEKSASKSSKGFQKSGKGSESWLLKSGKSKKSSKPVASSVVNPADPPAYLVSPSSPSATQAKPTEIASATAPPPTQLAKAPDDEHADAPTPGRPVSPLGACPKAYDVAVTYEEGDEVSLAVLLHSDPRDLEVADIYRCEPAGQGTSCGDVGGEDWAPFGTCDPFLPVADMAPALATPDGCPPSYDAAAEYAAGDIVSAPDADDAGSFNAYECEPIDEFPTCDGASLGRAWAFLGICHEGTSSPAGKPIATRAPSQPPTPSPSPPLPPKEEHSSCLSAPGREDFEGGAFPVPPWTTGGDGTWAIDTGGTYEGLFSIRSPNLSGATSPTVSNATISTCDAFAGGRMTLGVKAGVLPPHDILVIAVDGANEIQMIDAIEWREVSVDIPPGRHRIDFSYRYNVFNVNPLPPSPPHREGVVYIDDVTLIETVSPLLSKRIHLEGLASSSKVQTESSDGQFRSSVPSQWYILGLCCVASLLL